MNPTALSQHSGHKGLNSENLNSLNRLVYSQVNSVRREPQYIERSLSMDAVAAPNNLRAYHASVETTPREYDLSKLTQLPNEIVYKLFSNLDQKSLESFFDAMEGYIQSYMASKSYLENSLNNDLETNRPGCIQLLKMAVMSFSKDVEFNQTIYKILDYGKRLGFKRFFENASLLNVNFSDEACSSLSLSNLQALLEGISCGCKTLILHGLREQELLLSVQSFPKLETLRIVNAPNLQVLKVNPSEEAIHLDYLYILGTTALKTIDIQPVTLHKTLYIEDATQLTGFCFSSESYVAKCRIGEDFEYSASFVKSAGFTLTLKNFEADSENLLSNIDSIVSLLKSQLFGTIRFAECDNKLLQRLAGLLRISVDQVLWDWNPAQLGITDQQGTMMAAESISQMRQEREAIYMIP